MTRLPNGKRGNLYETINRSGVRRPCDETVIPRDEGHDVPATLTTQSNNDDPTLIGTHEYDEPVVTEPTAPPLTLYVSMETNDSYVTRPITDVADKSCYL